MNTDNKVQTVNPVPEGTTNGGTTMPIITDANADYTTLSIAGLLARYNTLADQAGVPHRAAFRDRAAALKAVEGIMVQLRTDPGEEKRKEEPVAAKPTTGLKAKLVSSLKRGRQPSITGKETITVTWKGEKPPRIGPALERWNLFRDGMTVDEFARKVGDRKVAIKHVAWDSRRGWIKLTKPV